MEKKIKWGIMGPGRIAQSFAKGLHALNDAELYAVGSRSKERAESFAKEFEAKVSYDSYEALVNDPEVDAIYVATPHPSHKECVLKALRAKKAVLCEKPFTVNSKDTEELINTARENKVFLMEAMWTRFLPAVVKTREWIKAGTIGEVRMVKADFGFRGEWKPEDRLLNKKLGGGALLDVGIYPISFTSMIYGIQPDYISSTAHIGTTGVDEQFASIFKYNEGQMALLSGAIRTQTPQDAWILGTEGYIYLHEFWHAQAASLYVDDKLVEEYNPPFISTGYNYEAEEVSRCLREGKLESSVMPLDESLAVMKTLDNIRNEFGLVYPCE